MLQSKLSDRERKQGKSEKRRDGDRKRERQRGRETGSEIERYVCVCDMARTTETKSKREWTEKKRGEINRERERDEI